MTDPISRPGVLVTPTNSESSATHNPPQRNASSKAGYFRWVICALLLFGTTKNYMDRQVLSVLKGTLQHDLRWDEIDYSNVVFAFQTAYALGMVLVGRLGDRLGSRSCYMVAMVFLSSASI